MHFNQSMIKLREIVEPVPAVPHSMLASAVLELFRSQPELHGLVVTENKLFLGIIRKSQFYRKLSRTFALDLFSRRPIQLMLDSNPLSMDADLDIASALALLLRSDPALGIDSFPVISDGHCLGIVPVSSLMMHISKSQAQLLQALEMLNARMSEEFNQAARVQQALLPSRNFRFTGINIAAELVTSTEVGGDFFDYFVVENRKVCLVIADVSGHGVQAGMVTTAAKASLHTLIRQGIATPAGLLNGMNGAILATAHQNLLMTCLVLIVDFEERCCLFANAGHNFPYLYRTQVDSISMIQCDSGFPLGFDENAEYMEHHFAFSPGDMIILYSDGVNECSNGADIYGFERFEDCLGDISDIRPELLVQKILGSLSSFRGRNGFDDDVTLLIAKFEDGFDVCRSLDNGHTRHFFGGVA
jgi:phosphoserine phosphatase RsbU/P